MTKNAMLKRKNQLKRTEGSGSKLKQSLLLQYESNCLKQNTKLLILQIRKGEK